MSEPQSVAATLGREVAGHRLQFNPEQQRAALRLDGLRENLQTAASTRQKRWWSKLPWLTDAARGKAPRGVYLWGGVGRGKTLLMDLFVASLQSAGGGTIAAERIHFYRFMRDVHAQLDAIKQRPQPLDLVAQRIASRTRVLCLDEFFVADIADAMILAGLFEGLFRRGVALVTTSNLAPQDLYQDGLQRQRFVPAIELIERHVEAIHLEGGIDYRLRRLTQAPTYLDSNSADTPAAMQSLFAALTRLACETQAGTPAHGGVQCHLPLTIEGRSLNAVQLAGGTAWFEFRELCEGPRSQNDYIELARLFHTLFVANAPRFEIHDDDAARRFIMLIDELYDRGVKLVVSAAAAPSLLYRGERLRFEFERAASRLIEMQSEQYLAGQHRP